MLGLAIWLAVAAALRSPSPPAQPGPAAKYPVNTNQPRVDRPVPLRYPPGYLTLLWDVQASTDRVHWATVATNVGPGDFYVTNRPERSEDFRMKGHP